MNDKLYDFLKYVALVILPAIAALYFGLGQIWNLPAVEQIVGTITVLDTFLGIILNKTHSNFAAESRRLLSLEPAGDLIVQQNIDGLVVGMRLEANNDPFIVNDQKRVVFEVKREQQL